MQGHAVFGTLCAMYRSDVLGEFVKRVVSSAKGPVMKMVRNSWTFLALALAGLGLTTGCVFEADTPDSVDADVDTPDTDVDVVPDEPDADVNVDVDRN